MRRALVIAGSDQRGTIFGAYDVSKEIGVSPWHFWDDVEPRHVDELFVLPGRHTQGTPKVKYRGFFINDENPATGTWAPEFLGPGHAEGFPSGLNSEYYEKVFEAMLRLKANYLWPAVWGRAFAEDDPENHATAKRYGIVMGTSHEAPMMRGIEEWNRHAKPAKRDAQGTITEPGSDPYGGTGEWSFRRNRDAIIAYWREGAQRMKDQGFEGVVTLGMRGNGDVALPDGEGIELMQEIIDTQLRILDEVFGKEAAARLPKVNTLYKEVQRYWDKGLRARDDVTIVFADDNWGNMRKLPDPSLPARSGGYGLYYHFDYVGGGRNYKWVDTINLANTWEQLHLSYAYGVDRLWMVNVGDLKNEEMPTQFFLDYAWDPSALPLHKIDDWERGYAAQNFGGEHAADIAEVLHDYGVLQARRKPELLNRRIMVDRTKDLSTDPTAVVYDDQASPFSLTNYRELQRVTREWQRLAAEAERLRGLVRGDQQDAYYQLVLYQVAATANLYELRLAQFTNLLYARQGRAATNAMADETEARFAEDQAMSAYYNNELAGGKWKGWQTQPKIGYGDVERYGPSAPWQQPETTNPYGVLPDALYPHLKRIDVPAAADMGVAVEGSEQWWPHAEQPARLRLSRWSSLPVPYLEVFNRGQADFTYSVTSGEPWLTVDRASGTVDDQSRLTVRADWTRAPKGRTEVPVTITGSEGTTVVVTVVVEHPDLTRARLHGFVEADGYVSMEAAHRSRAVNSRGVWWQRIPDIGRTGDGMTPFPVTAKSRTPGGNSPRLEYDMTLHTEGPVTVYAYLSPRNNVLPTEGLRYAVSIDGAAPQIVNVTTWSGANDTTMNKQWERNTSDNANVSWTTHQITGKGRHTLKFWMVDPTVVVQKLVVDTGGLQWSYLGPPESRRFVAGREVRRGAPAVHPGS